MRILFAAHDPGGARALLPVMACARERGHRAILMAAGPARKIWMDAGECPDALDIDRADLDDFLKNVKPNVALTGTSMHSDFERGLWPVLRDKGVPSIALLDAWINLRLRFDAADGGNVQPDIIGVIDEGMAEKAMAEPWLKAAVSVLGQPHLESMVNRISALRAEKRRKHITHLLAVFSETLAQDHPGERGPGFDQYTTIATLVPALEVVAPCRVVVQPHPREDRAELAAFLEGIERVEGVEVGLSEMDTENLVATADAAIGMTTMVLVEAALVGVPALSLQLNRTREHNPAIDAMPGITVVTEKDALRGALRSIVRTAVEKERPMPSFEGSAARVVDAAERAAANQAR